MECAHANLTHPVVPLVLIYVILKVRKYFRTWIDEINFINYTKQILAGQFDLEKISSPCGCTP